MTGWESHAMDFYAQAQQANEKHVESLTAFKTGTRPPLPDMAPNATHL